MRIRKAKSFRGIEEIKLGIRVPQRFAFEIKRISWILTNTNPLFALFSPITVLPSFISDSYVLAPKEFETPSSPPPGPHVVMGIFEDSGTLREEVVIYIGGHSMSKQLVRERRGLFSLPILRDIKAFELYKASKLFISFEHCLRY